ncbi:hypothetical protein CSUI_007726 [Cystoisospora suis]|uniref:Uncharacterized protein n=1 Tax=Cystoisospora suis TaxID=483139 RepID=A0A2C6KCP7_9APIC|nr:hypothetical protein CSUI_007726 [Cystoisospora suis]
MHRSPMQEATLLPGRSSHTQETRSPRTPEVENPVTGARREAGGWGLGRQSDEELAQRFSAGARLSGFYSENSAEAPGFKKRDNVEFFVPYSVTTFRSRQQQHRNREQERPKDNDAGGEGRGVSSSCGLWDETESDDTQLGEVSDAASVSTAAPPEIATNPLPGLVGSLCRQTDDLNDELDHLIRALLLYNKRASLSAPSDDYPDEASAVAAALATVKQQHQADLERIQEARLRDRAKSDVQIAKLQGQVQHLQAECKELQESLTEKELSYRRLQAHIKALQAVRHQKAPAESEADVLYASLLLQPDEVQGPLDEDNEVTTLTQTCQRLAQNVGVGLRGKKLKEPGSVPESPADFLKTEFELKLQSLRSLKGSHAPALHEWLRLFVSAWKTLQTRLKSVAIPEKSTEKVLQLAKEKLEKERALTFKALIQVQQESLRVMKQVFETPWRAEELAKENKEKDQQICSLEKDLHEVQADNATLAKELKRRGQIIEELGDNKRTLSAELGLCRADLDNRFEELLQKRAKLRVTQEALHETTQCLEAATTELRETEQSLEGVVAKQRSTERLLEEARVDLSDKEDLLDAFQKDLEKFEKANAQLTDALNATRAELAETTIELHAERLAASQERSQEVQEWRRRHKQVEENLLEALKRQRGRPDKASLRHRFRIRAQPISKSTARRVFGRFRARLYLSHLSSRSRGLRLARSVEEAGEKEKLIGPESAEALRRLEKTWGSILVTVDRVEKQVHAVYSSRRSYTVFSRELRGLDKILGGLRPRYEKAQAAFQLLKERAQGRTSGSRRGAGVGRKERNNEEVVRPRKAKAPRGWGKASRKLAEVKKAGKKANSTAASRSEAHVNPATRGQKRLGFKEEPRPCPHRRRVSSSLVSVLSNTEEDEEQEELISKSEELRLDRGRQKTNEETTRALPVNSAVAEGSSELSGSRSLSEREYAEDSGESRRSAGSLSSSEGGLGEGRRIRVFNRARGAGRKRSFSSASFTGCDSFRLSRGNRYSQRTRSCSPDSGVNTYALGGKERFQVSENEAMEGVELSREVKRLEGELRRSQAIIKKIEETLMVPQDYFKKMRDLTEENVRLNLLICSLRADIERGKQQRKELETLRQAGVDYSKFQVETEKRIRDLEKQLRREVAAAGRATGASAVVAKETITSKHLENMRIEHQLEIQTLKDMNALEMERLRQNHDREISVLQQAIQSIKDNAALEYKKKAQLLQLQQEAAIEKIRCDFESQIRDLRQEYDRELQGKQMEKTEALSRAEVGQQAALAEAAKDYNRKLKEVEKHYEKRLLEHQVNTVKERDELIARFKAKLTKLTTELEEEKTAAQKCRETHEVRHAEAKRQIAELERQLRAESLEKDELREAVERQTARADNFQEELGTARRQGRGSVAPLSDHACQAGPEVRSRGTQVEDTVFEYIRECTEILQEATNNGAEAAPSSMADIMNDRQELPSGPVKWIRSEGNFLTKPPDRVWAASCLEEEKRSGQKSLFSSDDEEESARKDESSGTNREKDLNTTSKKDYSLEVGDHRSVKLLGNADRIHSDSDKEDASFDKEDALFRKVAAVALRAKSRSLEPTACTRARGRAVSTEKDAPSLNACSKEAADSREPRRVPKTPSSVRYPSSARTSFPSAASTPISSLFERLKDNQRSVPQPRQSPHEARMQSSESEVRSDVSPFDSLRARALETLHRARPKDQRADSFSTLANRSRGEKRSEQGAGSTEGEGLRKGEAVTPTSGSADSLAEPNSPRRQASVKSLDAQLFGQRESHGTPSGLAKEEGTEQLLGATRRDTERIQEGLLTAAEEAETKSFRAKEETEILRLLQQAGEHSEADLREADASDLSRQSRGILARTDISLISRTLDADLRKLRERARAPHYSIPEGRGIADRRQSAPRSSIVPHRDLPVRNEDCGIRSARLSNSRGWHAALDAWKGAPGSSGGPSEYSTGLSRNGRTEGVNIGGVLRHETQGSDRESYLTRSDCRPGGGWTRRPSATDRKERVYNTDGDVKWSQTGPQGERREDEAADGQRSTSLFQTLSGTAHQINLERNAVRYGVREIVRRNKQPAINSHADPAEKMKVSIAEQMKVSPPATDVTSAVENARLHDILFPP